MNKKYQLLSFSFLLVFLVVGFVVTRVEQPVQADLITFDEQEATVRAINNSISSVVNVMVYSNTVNTKYDLVGGAKETVNERELVGQGTGFLISDNGWILTNKHVVEASNASIAEYTVVLNDGRKFGAFLIGKDPFNDLAILRVLGKDFPYLELAPNSDLPIGTTVLAIGNALGRYQNSVTKGIISGLCRSIVASDKYGNAVGLDNVIQTDAEINQGNSGGPLINLLGEVVGVNVAVDNAGSSIGFAIPVNDVKPVINSIVKYGRIIRPWLGVRYIMITPELFEGEQLSVNEGALLITNELGDPAVVAGSPAGKAGLKKDDIILEANGVVLNLHKTLLSVTQSYGPGDELKLKVRRGDVVFDIVIILEEYKQ